MLKNLRLILGDQLSEKISSLKNCDKNHDIILMCEVLEEATYVKHHPKKIAFIFSAMRHFAVELKAQNYRVEYIHLDDRDNTQSFTGELQRAVKTHHPQRVIVTEPSEYRVQKDMADWSKRLNCPVDILVDDRFFCSKQEFQDWAKDRKQLRMEFFYREMRKKHNILMQDGKPSGGEWNYDQHNRKTPPNDLTVPPVLKTPIDEITQNVLDLVKTRFADHFGDLEPFHMAVTRKDALKVLKHFITQRLTYFGDYQDAMLEGEPWMFHSLLSFYINCGLLLPDECIDTAVKAHHKDKAPLAAVEGFVRQILGWREYVRGVYWLQMPSYKSLNFFQAKRSLPKWYWDGETKMNCLKQCIKDTKTYAYAHHIQRLMVLGNFALLTGLDPNAVNEWYLIVYADAYEWVELPNVTGMILFADGGLLASKPYAAGGNYINKMSNYCKNCVYKVKEKTGAKACPFNYLYWHFLSQHRDKLEKNPRLKMIYRTWDLMKPQQKGAVTKSASHFLEMINQA